MKQYLAHACMPPIIAQAVCIVICPIKCHNTSRYPGAVKVDIVDDLTCRINTKAQGYPAALYYYLSSFLPIMSAKDIANKAHELLLEAIGARLATIAAQTAY